MQQKSHQMHQVLGFFFLLFGACAAQGQPSTRVKALLAAEDQRFEAMVRQDTAYLRGVLDRGLRYIHSNGLTETRDQHLAAVAGGKIRYERMEPIVRHADLTGSTAWVRGELHAVGALQGAPFDIRLAYTACYVRGGNRRWALRYWQSTRIEG